MIADLPLNDMVPAEGDAPALEEPAALVDEGPDDTGIHLSAATSPGIRAKPVSRIRIANFAIPTGPLAWALSILIHGAVIVGACIAVRVYFSHAAPPASWEGGGSTGGGIAVSSAAADTMQGGLGDLTPPPVMDQSRIRAESSEQDKPESPPGPARKFASLASDDPDASAPIIGVAGTGRQDVGPSPSRHRRGDGLINPVSQPTRGVLQGANAAGASAPGLPAVLVTRGLPVPEYPVEARRRGQQGIVKVALEVLPDGSIGQVHVTSEPGFPLLRQSALSAAAKLRAFRFIPARRFGQPVCDLLIVPYRFSLR